MDPADVAAVGMSGVSKGDAGAVSCSTNPDYADLIYSTALSALMAGKTVTMQGDSGLSGYLTIDRIWIKE